MLSKDENGHLIIPKNELSTYISSRLKELGWKEDKILAEKSGLSTAEVSRLKKGDREGVSPTTFLKLYKAFGDPISKAIKVVYPDLDLSLAEYKSKKRNSFGQYMSSFETIENAIEIVAEKTGIGLPRLKEIYYRTGAPEAYELLLIEKALGKKSGEIFEEFFGVKK